MIVSLELSSLRRSGQLQKLHSGSNVRDIPGGDFTSGRVIPVSSEVLLSYSLRHMRSNQYLHSPGQAAEFIGKAHRQYQKPPAPNLGTGGLKYTISLAGE
jgi:hypothetical protein